MNSIQIVGRLTADPQIFDGSKTVTRFRVAIDRPGSKEADFVPVVVFDQLAGVVGEHLAKGRLVGVTGRLNTRRWITADGENRSVLEVVAVSVSFLDRPARQSGGDQDASGAERDLAVVR